MKLRFINYVRRTEGRASPRDKKKKKKNIFYIPFLDEYEDKRKRRSPVCLERLNFHLPPYSSSMPHGEFLSFLPFVAVPDPPPPPTSIVFMVKNV